ncbi:flagellar hook protein FlgE [Brevundimonas sp.]|uniref:flagellar hook protein FlgE n=1 Tax=Brevundimonas sp. TaxID=1871086 RepID=UPI0035642B0C
MQAIAIASAGIADATARFGASAVRTARDPLGNLEGEIVERLTAEVALKANVAVLKTADRMYGSLLDIRA